MSRNKHSYIPFYMDDWQGGTAGMPRQVWSVYFQVCLHNWDKVKPISRAHLSIIASDLGELYESILLMLLESGHVKENDQGFYNERALAVGQEAYDRWLAKSEGGRKGGLKTKSGESKAEALPKAKPKDSLSTPSRSPQHNQNQNQNHKDNTNVLSSPDLDEDEEALQKIQAAQAKFDAITEGAKQVADAWNDMAKVNGLPLVVKITAARSTHLRARVADYGAEQIIDAISQVPSRAFLMGKGSRGWKANFDFIIRPDTVAKILEGQYNGEQGEQSTGNGFLDAVIDAERAGGSE